MNKLLFSIIWWNTSLSPPTAPTKVKEKNGQLSKTEKLKYISDVIRYFMSLDYDFICLGEVLDDDIIALQNSLNLYSSTYTLVSGVEKFDGLYFDTCILYKKEHSYIPAHECNVRKVIISISGRKVRVGQRFEFKYSYTSETLVLYLSHWPNPRSADQSIYDSIAQELRSSLSTDLNSNHAIVLLGDYNVEPCNHSLTNKLQTSREKELVKYRKELFYNPFWKFLSKSQIVNSNAVNSEIYWSYFLKKTGLFNSCHVIDQIMFSSNFLSNSWKFDDNLIKIINPNDMINLTSKVMISDHMIVSAHIEKKVVLGGRVKENKI